MWRIFSIMILGLLALGTVRTRAADKVNKTAPGTKRLDLNSATLDAKRTFVEGTEPQVHLKIYFRDAAPAQIARFVPLTKGRFPVFVDGKMLVREASAEAIHNGKKQLIGFTLTLKQKSDAEVAAKALRRHEQH